MINIVPPHPSTVEPGLLGQPTRMAAGAQMTYRGGPLLKAVEVTAVFLGDWTLAQTQPITTFLASIVPSSYLDALAEYNVGHGSYKGAVTLPWSSTPPPPPPPPPGSSVVTVGSIGNGSVLVNGQAFSGDYHSTIGAVVTFTAVPANGSAFSKWTGSGGSSTSNPLTVTLSAPTGTITANFVAGSGCLPTFGLARIAASLTPAVRNAAPTSITDAEIRARLNAAISAGPLPARNANTLYMTFVQQGVAVIMSDGSASCSVFCGYHDSDGTGMYYGVIPYPNCGGCTGTMSAFNALTSVTTHELAEAVTDPVPGASWYNNASGEIGDPCAWTNRMLNGYTVQLEWLNSKSGCA